MRNWTKAAVLGVGLMGAMTAAGCAYDDGYDHDSSYSDRDHYYGDRDRHDSYRATDDTARVRVCDADGDDCHWEYRRR